MTEPVYPIRRLTPVFNTSRMQGIISVQMNTEFALGLLEVLEDFDDLPTHEFAFRAALRRLLGDQLRVENREGG